MTHPRRRVTARTLVIGILTVTLLGAGVAGAAGWFDDAQFRAGVSSGSWSPTPGPTVPPKPSPGPTTPDHTVPADGAFQPGNSRTEISAVTWTDGGGAEITSGTSASNPGRQECAAVTVRGRADSSAAETSTPWQVLVDYTQAPYHGERPNFGWVEGQHVSDADATHFLISGVVTLSPGQQQVVQVCNYWQYAQLPAAEGISDITVGDPWWTGTGVGEGDLCVEVDVIGTVTDLTADPFFHGWSHQVDLSEATRIYRSARPTDPSHVVFTPGPEGGYSYRIDSESTDWMPFRQAYQLSSSTTTFLRGTGSVSLRACLTQN